MLVGTGLLTDGVLLRATVQPRLKPPQIFITDADGVPHQLTSEGKNHSPTWTAEAK